MIRKRVYEKKLRGALKKNREFLLMRLGNEWDQIQKKARHEEIVKMAKSSATTIAKGVLALLAVGGVLTVAIVAPNMFAAVGRIAGRRGFFDQTGFEKATKYLKKKKYVSMRKNSVGYSIRLTADGADVILSRAWNDLKVAPQQKWDGLWRIILFDIPDKHKWSRDAFRERLRALGFYRLQESVFVYPFPCDEEVRFVISLLGVVDYVRVVETETIVPDDDLHDFFKV